MTHSFDIDVAMAIGIEKAILLQNICYWVQKNEANGKHFHEGRYWTYNSTKAFAKLFPYMAETSIRRHIEWLCSNGYLLKGNFNEDPMDRTAWFALSDEGEELLGIGKNEEPDEPEEERQNEQMHLAKMTNASGKNDKCYIGTNIKHTDIKHNIISRYTRYNGAEDNFSDSSPDARSGRDAPTPTPTPSPRKAFRKPDVEEVEAYCRERNNTVDAQTFVDFYESKGWKVGRTPMMDWKAAVRTWERGRNESQAKSFSNGNDRKYNSYTPPAEHKASDYEQGF